MPNPAAIAWYRTPIPAEKLKELHERSDLLGFLQSAGYLLLITSTGTAAYLAAGRLPWWAVVALLLLHGMVCAFLPNAIHELCHGTVFRTKRLNTAFLGLFSFLNWHNHEVFWASHERHHRYTLHPPDDLEVVLPMHLFLRNLLTKGFVDPAGLWWNLKRVCRFAVGGFEGPWELTLYPADRPQDRRGPVAWSRFVLLGHGLIVAVSLYLHLWMLPVVVSLPSFYGSWLFQLCNNSQHMGLMDNVQDFRLCCRTITLSAPLQFVYWHMNYHIEHHMYAAVPCYRLGRLHQAIRHDLPACPHGLAQTWREIGEIQRRQKVDPSYQFKAVLPS